jgi:hypothetical protein
MVPNQQEIQNILRKFNLMGYADESTEYEDNGKGGKILTRTEGEWKYEDEFYGGEPYSGNETLWFNGKDVFRCVYWGKVAEGINFSDIYSFLRRALKEEPNDGCVHRGPKIFVEGDSTYTNECTGTIDEFVQTERISVKDKEVYKAYFIGGRVNVQK